MDSIDVLSDRPERRKVFSPALLSELDDDILQEIVAVAAAELNVPAVLVTLVLDHVVLFKAHYGIGGSLLAAKGVPRDVTFCQFVVRDGEPFEVNDAPQDPRIPQQMVRVMGLKAYLGIPIKVEDTVIGSLCALDGTPRQFSAKERQQLSVLAARVSARCTALASAERPAGALAQRAAAPAIQDLANTFSPIPKCVDAGLVAMPAVQAFLRMAAFASDGGEVDKQLLKHTLEMAARAADDVDNMLCDLEVQAIECGENFFALQELSVTSTSNTRLSVVLTAAQDLARSVTQPVGGVVLPDLHADPLLACPKGHAVGLLSTALMAVSRHIPTGRAGRLHLSVDTRSQSVAINIGSSMLPGGAVHEVASELRAEISEDLTVRVEVEPRNVMLVFRVAIPLSVSEDD